MSSGVRSEVFSTSCASSSAGQPMDSSPLPGFSPAYRVSKRCCTAHTSQSEIHSDSQRPDQGIPPQASTHHISSPPRRQSQGHSIKLDGGSIQQTPAGRTPIKFDGGSVHQAPVGQTPNKFDGPSPPTPSPNGSEAQRAGRQVCAAEATPNPARRPPQQRRRPPGCRAVPVPQALGIMRGARASQRQPNKTHRRCCVVST